MRNCTSIETCLFFVLPRRSHEPQGGALAAGHSPFLPSPSLAATRGHVGQSLATAGGGYLSPPRAGGIVDLGCCVAWVAAARQRSFLLAGEAVGCVAAVRARPGRGRPWRAARAICRCRAYAVVVWPAAGASPGRLWERGCWRQAGSSRQHWWCAPRSSWFRSLQRRLTTVGGLPGLDGAGQLGRAWLWRGCSCVQWRCAAELGGWPQGLAFWLAILSLCCRVDLRVKALRGLWFVPTTVTPSSIVLLLVGVPLPRAAATDALLPCWRCHLGVF
jgi:hypothetical protein